VDYTITHTTRYAYTSPVSVCQNVVALTPRDDGRVHCWVHRLRIRPGPINTHRRTDYFGNILTVFSIDESHDELMISAISRVTVQSPAPMPSEKDARWEVVRQDLSLKVNPEWHQASRFLFNSPRVERRAEYAEYALQSFQPGTSVLMAALDLAGRIQRDFTYDTKATETHTPTEIAFSIRKGVCQDFAHIMIACLRSIGIPARYVSGYLRTIPPLGKPRLVGADQSHAWVAVYCGQELGWIELDPTNNCSCGMDHIPVAWGRDYSDVVPVRGAYLGGGESTIGVSVDVVPQEVVFS